MKQGSSRTTTILFMLLIITVAALFFVLGKMQGMKTIETQLPSPTTTQRIIPREMLTDIPSPTSLPIPKTASVEGTLSYPSSFIPNNMNICAINTTSQLSTCTNKHIQSNRFTTGVGYHLDLVPGTYQVYAYLLNETGSFKDYKAYYDDYVTCGLKYGCPSHTPITLTIEPGKTYTNINPQDWYNTP